VQNFQKAQTEQKSRAGKLGGKIGKQQLGQLGPKNPNWFIEKKMGGMKLRHGFVLEGGRSPTRRTKT